MIVSRRIFIPIVLVLIVIPVHWRCSLAAETPDPLLAEGVIFGLWTQTHYQAAVAADPEAWAGDFQRQPFENEGILFVYSHENLHLIDCSILPFQADILFISSSNQIDFILTHCDPATRAVSPEPVVAALCMTAGFVHDNRIEPGQFITYPRMIRLEAKPTDPLEQREKWLPVLEKTAADHSDCLACQLILAEHYLYQNRFEDVINLLSPLMENQPGQAVIIPLAKAMALQGEFDAAIDLFSAILKKETSEKAVVFYVITTLHLSKPVEDRIGILTDLYQEHPGNISLAVALAREHLKLNNVDQAFAFISQCIDSIGPHPELMREKGNILLRQGDYRKAAQAYLQYIEAGPFDPGIRDYRSFITVHLLRKQLLQNR